MCEALLREGVSVMFGVPGGAIMPFYYAMYEYRDRLHHVLCRHEQGAGHAAEGYARSTGRAGVCVATSGPGATNLVTPIADAWMDSTPLVAITGQVSSTVLGKDAFQETDITGITVPITKHNYLVKRAEDLPVVFREAFYLATTGRPGPVLIDVTKDAQQAKVIPDWTAPIRLPGYTPTYDGCAHQVCAAVELLVAAERPLIMAGNGVIQSGASAELLELAERTGIPVITTLHGLGAFPQDHPLSIGMPGMHGWVHVNRAIQECDVLLNIGGRFDDRVTGNASSFAPHAKIIHIDIDPSEIGKNVRVAVPIVGDAQRVLRMMLGLMPCRWSATWLGHIRDVQAKYQRRHKELNRPHTEALMPHEVYAALNDALKVRGPSRVVTDVGQHRDVGGAAHRVVQAPESHHLGWRWHDGICGASGARRCHGPSGRDRVGDRRRRRIPDDESGARDDRPGRLPQHQDRRDQQWLSRHGAPVAGVVRRSPLQRHVAQRP